MLPTEHAKTEIRYDPKQGYFIADAPFPIGFMSRVAHDSDPSLGHKMAAGPELVEASTKLLARYVSLAGSGDCGFWDPETETEVIAMRAALALAAAP